MAKEELIIVPEQPESVFIDGNVKLGQFTEYVRRWHTGRAIKRDPMYVAYYVSKVGSIRAIAEVDLKEPDLDDGLMVIKGDPIPVDIPIRFGKDSLEGIRYTTFRKLLTHDTTDDL